MVVLEIGFILKRIRVKNISEFFFHFSSKKLAEISSITVQLIDINSLKNRELAGITNM